IQGYSFGSATPWVLAPNFSDTNYLSWGYFLEGFAEFYQFAVRNFVNINHKDISTWTNSAFSGNCEEGPFTNINSLYGRYYGVYSGDPHIGTKTCFIWNMYDQYSDAGYRASRFKPNENDDLGFESAIFNYLSTLGNSG